MPSLYPRVKKRPDFFVASEVVYVPVVYSYLVLEVCFIPPPTYHSFTKRSQITVLPNVTRSKSILLSDLELEPKLASSRGS